MTSAFESSGVDPEDLTTWDLHATATPGDYLEVQNLLEVAPDSVMVTARKGTFGHGMGAAGGWELTAQHLGIQSGEILPVNVEEEEFHEMIRPFADRLVQHKPVSIKAGQVTGKINMGLGGVNGCIICKPWDD